MATEHIASLGGGELIHSRAPIFEIGPESEPITVSAGEFVAAPPGLAHSFCVAESGPARRLTIPAPDGGFAAFVRGLRDGVKAEGDIAPVPADGGRPAEQIVISRQPRGVSRSSVCATTGRHWAARRSARPVISWIHTTRSRHSSRIGRQDTRLGQCSGMTP